MTIIDVIAPASAVDKSIYKSCLKLLEENGFSPRVLDYDKLIDKKSGFCANSAKNRFEDLYKALNAKDSEFIWSIAGGYGSYQLLEELDKMPKPKLQKTFIGFSDVTVLSNYFIDKWGWKTLHAPMLNRMPDGRNTQKSIEHTFDLINKKSDFVEIENVDAINEVAKSEAKIEGKIIGGCLSLMQTFLGTSQDVKYKDKILLLEDDEFETAPRVSRVFNHMLRAGVFDKVKAVILGSLFENKIDEQGQIVFDYLKNELEKRNVPLLRAQKLGHCADMQPVPLGTDAIINLGEKPIVRINN